MYRPDFIMIRGKGSMLLNLCLIADEPISPINVIALSYVEVKIIDLSLLKEMMSEN